VAGNDDYDYGIKQAGNDDYDYDEGRYLFFRLVAQSREKNLLIINTGGGRVFLSPSMQHLVFWPHAGAWGAGVILSPCAQLLWCELYVVCMKNALKKKKTGNGQRATGNGAGRGVWGCECSCSLPYMDLFVLVFSDEAA